MRRGIDALDRARIEELWRALHAELRRRGVDGHTAEDLTQETWLVALQRPPEERGRLGGWMRVVARRQLLRLRQVARARGSTDARELADLPGPEPDGPEREDLERLARAVAALPE